MGKAMLFRRLAVALALALSVTGCGGASQCEIEQTRQSLRSWIRSLDFAAQQQAAHRVPSRFLPQLLKSATQTLERERRKIDNAAPEQRADVEPLAKELESKIHQQQERLAHARSE
jgi:hypothetical protein